MGVGAPYISFYTGESTAQFYFKRISGVKKATSAFNSTTRVADAGGLHREKDFCPLPLSKEGPKCASSILYPNFFCWCRLEELHVEIFRPTWRIQSGRSVYPHPAFSLSGRHPPRPPFNVLQVGLSSAELTGTGLEPDLTPHRVSQMCLIACLRCPELMIKLSSGAGIQSGIRP